MGLKSFPLSNILKISDYSLLQSVQISFTLYISMCNFDIEPNYFFLQIQCCFSVLSFFFLPVWKALHLSGCSNMGRQLVHWHPLSSAGIW